MCVWRTCRAEDHFRRWPNSALMGLFLFSISDVSQIYPLNLQLFSTQFPPKTPFQVVILKTSMIIHIFHTGGSLGLKYVDILLCSSILLYWNRFLLLWTSKQTNLQYKYLFHKLSLPLQVVTYFWLLRRWAHRMDSNWVCWILNRLMRYTSSDRVIWVHLILITHI